MPAHDERAELAPRDIVARAIDFEMKKHGLDYVLPRHHAPAAPTSCRSTSRPSTRAAWSSASTSRAQPIPVVPAAHYTCGGVVTDLHGRTDLPGLYAVGETAYTGLHGANRLASNSLLECVVFGRACADDILAHAAPPAAPRCRPGTRAASTERRRAGRDRAQLGRAAPLHVELRRHRAHHQAAGARAAPHHSCCRSEIEEYYAQLPRHPRPAGAAQPRRRAPS